MGPGLAKMLELINSNPTDSMLVDRFLVLASDTHEHERADATLLLAATLLPKQPRRALEIAWMVYKSSLRDNESLASIAKALDGLGKHTKAEIVRSEMKRINNDKLSEDIKNLARLTIEEHVTNTLAGNDAVNFDLRSEARGEDLTIAEFDLGESIKVQAEEGDRPSLVETLQLDDLKLHELFKGNHEPMKAANLSGDSMQVGHPSVARVSASMPGAGIPEAIPPKEPSKHSIGAVKISPADGQQEIGPVSSGRLLPQNSSPVMSMDERRRRLQALITSEKWDAVFNLLLEAFANADDPILLPLFERNKLEQIDLRYSEYWIDVLIAARQERRALRYIIKKLNDEPHLAWARMLFPKVKLIEASLDLTPIEWREVEGVSVLRDRIAKMRPRLGCYWAG